jgi:predicted porin
MKKSLIALAALSAIAGVAQAQSTATFYGVLDAGYSSFDAKNGAGAKNTVSGVAYSALDTSRWGFTTSEDLGGGMKAGINVESTITGTPRDNFNYNGATSGTGTSSNASKLFGGVNGDLGAVAGGGNFSSSTGGGFAPGATVVGDRKLNAFIESGAHRLTAGFDSSTIRAAVVAFQPMDGNMLGNFVANDRSLTGASAGQGRNKSISYTYTQGTFNGTVGYVLGNNVKSDGADTTKVTDGFQIGANYATGALALGGAYAEYQGHTNVAAVTGVAGIQIDGSGNLTSYTSSLSTGNTAVVKPVAAAAAYHTDIKTKQTVLGASYDLTVAKLYAQYGKVDITDSLDPASASNDVRSMYSAGVTVPVGKAYAFAQYSWGKDKYGNPGSAYDGNLKGYSAGYRYAFSKRTTAYAALGHTEIDTSATTTVKANQTSVGILHAF